MSDGGEFKELESRLRRHSADVREHVPTAPPARQPVRRQQAWMGPAPMMAVAVLAAVVIGGVAVNAVMHGLGGTSSPSAAYVSTPPSTDQSKGVVPGLAAGGGAASCTRPQPLSYYVSNTAVIAEGTVTAGQVTVTRYLKGIGPSRLHVVRFDESAIPPNGSALLFLQPVTTAQASPSSLGLTGPPAAPAPAAADFGNMCLPAYALSNGQAQALTTNAGSQSQSVLEQRISDMAAGKPDPGPPAPGEAAAP